MSGIAVIGWLGAAGFAGCGVPQALECWKQGKADGLSPWFLWLWAAGEVLSFIYVSHQATLLWPVLANYVLNFTTLVVILRYKYWPRRPQAPRY